MIQFLFTDIDILKYSNLGNIKIITEKINITFNGIGVDLQPKYKIILDIHINGGQEGIYFWIPILGHYNTYYWLRLLNPTNSTFYKGTDTFPMTITYIA